MNLTPKWFLGWQGDSWRRPLLPLQPPGRSAVWEAGVMLDGCRGWPQRLWICQKWAARSSKSSVSVKDHIKILYRPSCLFCFIYILLFLLWQHPFAQTKSPNQDSPDLSLCLPGWRQKLKKPIWRQKRRWCWESKWQKRWHRKSYVTRRCFMRTRSELWRESWYAKTHSSFSRGLVSCHLFSIYDHFRGSRILINVWQTSAVLTFDKCFAFLQPVFINETYK